MKRTTETEEIRWQKIGGGSFNMGNRIIKPGQYFFAKLEDIPEGFRDVVVPSDGRTVETIEEEKVEEVDSADVEYFLKHRGGGWYNIVDADDKVISESAMKKEAAEEYLKSLS